MGVGLFSQEIHDRTMGNSLKHHQRRFRSDITKYFFTEKVVKYWNRLARAVVEPPSLKELKKMVNRAMVVFGQRLDLIIFEVFSSLLVL